MRHHSIARDIRKYRNKFDVQKAHVFIGAAIIAYGAFDCIRGFVGISDKAFDKEPTASAMMLIGGIYLLLTGLWFLTRTGINLERVIGLIVMVSGILAGTWGAMFIIASSNDEKLMFANIVFLSGILVHFMGVLYAKNE